MYFLCGILGADRGDDRGHVSLLGAGLGVVRDLSVYTHYTHYFSV
jgi:hypothetical protein